MSDKIDVYDDFAAEYAELVAARGEEAGIESGPFIRLFLSVIGDVSGLIALNAGCGEGCLSRILARRGANVRQGWRKMEIPKEQVAARKRQLLNVIDDLFVVFEEIHRLLSNWKPYYHAYFMKQMWKLKQLEADLFAPGYDEEFVLTVKKDVYRYFFGKELENA